jgi:hypothetical protein
MLKSLQARRTLRAERRRADQELLVMRLASPRLAWRTAELVADQHRIDLARSLTDVVRGADERRLPAASPLERGAIRECRAELLELASRLCDLDRGVRPRGVLLVERLLRGGPLYEPSTGELLCAELGRCLEEL